MPHGKHAHVALCFVTIGSPVLISFQTDLIPDSEVSLTAYRVPYLEGVLAVGFEPLVRRQCPDPCSCHWGVLYDKEHIK